MLKSHCDYKKGYISKVNESDTKENGTYLTFQL